VLPGAGALSKFTDIVSSNFKLICKLGLETEKLAATRDTLLPKLMSGEIDVEKVKVA
jgi:type I restriction enzyme S subunit